MNCSSLFTLVDLNVVILPDQTTQDKLIDISRGLASRVTPHFILNGGEFHPHLSLFPNQYPARNRDAIEAVLRQLSNCTGPFRITLTGYSQISGFIFTDAVKNPELVDLHTQAVAKLNPLREGHMPALTGSLRGLNKDQQANVEQYGNPIVLDAWQPHATLTHTDDINRAQQVLAELPPVTLEFEADAIHLSRFGPWGTCPEILKSFPFGK